jgi:CRISPR-associated protein Cas2
LFDLPTDGIEMKRDYRYFRKFLLENGFTMMQYSVYMRHSSSEENGTIRPRKIILL